MASIVKIMNKVLSVLVSVLLVSATIPLVFPVQSYATSVSHLKVVDVDILLYSGATMVIAEGGRLFASGQQYSGEFGNGGEYTQYNQFTEIDISQLTSPPVDIISMVGQTLLLTQGGELYIAGSTDQGISSNTFIRIDPALYGNKVVTQVFRTLLYTVFLTQDGEMYAVYNDYNAGGDIGVRLIPRPEAAGSSVTVKKATGIAGFGALMVLDPQGRVWVCQQIDQVLNDGIEPVWQQITVPSLGGGTVPIKEMTAIQYPYFLAEDGRVLYTIVYQGLDGTSFPFLEPFQMDFTDISGVSGFVPFYSPMVHSYFPNIRKTDGSIQFGRQIFESLGATDIPLEVAMVDASLYYPDADNATLFTIGQWGSPSAGTYLLNGYLYGVNADMYANNGVLLDPENPPEPFTFTSLLDDIITVINPAGPTFVGAVFGNINPSAAVLSPQQQGANAPIQANWQITGDQGIVTSGTSSLLQAPFEVSIQSLNLPDGHYSITWYRETMPEYIGEPLRSALSASATFVITSQPIRGADVTVRYVDTSGTDLLAPLVLSGYLDESYVTEAKSIEGFSLAVIPENAEGLFKELPQTVVYVYDATANNQGATLSNTGDDLANPLLIALPLLAFGAILVSRKKRRDFSKE